MTRPPADAQRWVSLAAICTAAGLAARAVRHVDWPGLVTVGLAVFALLYALTAGPVRGWGDPLVVGLFAAAVALAVAWVVIERRVAHPLVDLRLFHLRSYDGALTANLAMNLSFAGLSYLLVPWLQNVKGYSPVEAGLLLLPSTLGIFLFLPLGGRLDALGGGRRPVLAGLAVMAAGFGLIGFMNAGSGLVLLAVALVVIGLGLGLLSTPISNTAVGDVPEDLDGTAAGVFKMSSMVGGALGVAVLSGVARAFTSHDAGDALRSAGLTADQVHRAQHALVESDSFHAALATLPADTARRVTGSVIDAFSSGVAQTMVATGALVLVAAGIVALVWPRADPTAPTANPTDPTNPTTETPAPA